MRQERQQEWEARFVEQLQKREALHSDASWLQSMPQHCVQESRAKVPRSDHHAVCAAVQCSWLLLTSALRARSLPDLRPS
jgi:mannose/cellobiose epimerase-like protein (N-acyl-D-glucosamine 2-epimerase family)